MHWCADPPHYSNPVPHKMLCSKYYVHLLKLIFDESQVDSPNEIWIDVYQIIEFLKKNRSEVYMNNKETKDYIRKYEFYEDAIFE